MGARGPGIAALLAATLLCACVTSADPAAPQSVTAGRLLMGTVLEVTLLSRDPAKARARIEAEFAQVAELDALMSRYDPNSQLSELNASAGGPPRAVDPRLYELVQLAVEMAGMTGGSFDVTVGPLVELWIEAARRARLPPSEALRAARSKVGADRILLEDGRIALLDEGMSIDLGGIAKGFALDELAGRLRDSGQQSGLLNFGQSSAYALGAAPDGAGWRLLMPSVTPAPDGVLTLEDQALSISSSLGQSSEIDGRRYGHVVDPRSGFALSELRRAAVVAPSAALAEGLSTALVILDVEQGLSIVEAQHGAEALVEDERGVLGQTSGWQRATSYQLRALPPREPPAGAEAGHLPSR